MGKLIGILNGAKEIARDSINEVVNKRVEEEIVDAQHCQYEHDVYRTVCSFLELKVSDAEIYRLLATHFEMDSITEASEHIRKAKAHRQIINLREYLKQQHPKSFNYRQYAEDHRLEEKLQTNPRLLDLSAEKLRVAIEK